MDKYHYNSGFLILRYVRYILTLVFIFSVSCGKNTGIGISGTKSTANDIVDTQTYKDDSNMKTVSAAAVSSHVDELIPAEIIWERVNTEFRRTVRISHDTPFVQVYAPRPDLSVKRIRFYIHPLSASFIVTGYFGTAKLWDKEVHVGPLGSIKGWGQVDIPIKAKISQKIRLSIKPLTTSNKDVIITLPREILQKSLKRPQVILISLDTLRADHLPVYGYHRNTAPNLNEFSKHAFIFDDAMAPSPWTLPSHVSMLSGTDHHTHKVITFERQMPAGMPTMAALLSDDGYVAEAITGGGYISRVYFPYFHAFFEFTGGEYRKGDLQHNRPDLMKWVETHKDDSFLLFYHTYTIHDPYDGTHFLKGIKKGTHEYTVAQYDGGIYRADKVLGEFFDKLKKLGIFDDALIIVTSDHGEELADRHENIYGHGSYLYQEVIRVPLLIKFPQQKRTDNPVRVQSPVGLIDILPTVLDAVHLPYPRFLDGMSLYKVVDPENLTVKGKYNEREFTLGAQFTMGQLAPRLSSALRKGRYKMIRADRIMNGDYFQNKSELYDLRSDPGELKDLIEHSKFTVSDSVAASYMRSYWITSRHRIAHYEPMMQQKMSQALLDRLRALGYIQ